VVVAWALAVVVGKNHRRWKATRGVQEGDDARRRKGEEEEEVKARSWSR
jgi:hypothetical protein